MTFLALLGLAVALMIGATWSSNIWPGHETLWRAVVGRFLWWGLPFGTVVWANGASVTHAGELAFAAWVGAWVPHAEALDTSAHWLTVLGDAIGVVLRVAILLTPPGIVFYLCGAYWWAMVIAACMSVPCMQAALYLPHRWAGLRDERQVSGVLFGACVGACLVLAVWTPTPAPDLLP